MYVKRVLISLRRLESIVMKKSFELLLDYFPRISEVEDFLSTSIANCVLNSFLSYTAIMLNIITIYAIRKTPSLPKALKTMLLSRRGSRILKWGVNFRNNVTEPINI